MVGIFPTAGQICSATSRLLVHSSIADELTEALVAAATRVAVGDPLSESTQMGALISAAQQESVLTAVTTASADGGQILCGGGALRPEGLEGGYYVLPTVLGSVPFGSTGWTDEIFGPVICVRRRGAIPPHRPTAPTPHPST